MIHFVVALGLLAHAVFWGAGAAMLAMPYPWRRFWPVGIVAFGLALQSAVVWFGALVGWRGTDSYALAAQVIPVLLLAAGLRRRTVRGAWIDLCRFGVVWAALAGCLALLVLPVAIAAPGLTTISLGSCDAADYAAGARVLKEFARTDRTGFLGLTEVVRIASVDNFFDYWLRLNHFTPSALIAFSGSVLRCEPYELTTLYLAMLLAGSLPLVFWSARAVFGYSGGVSLIIAGLFGISPLMWYAYAHVSPGQLLAAQAVVMLTWAGVTLWRSRLSARRALSFGAWLAAGYWLVLGSYNFFVLLCLVPAVTYAAGLALAQAAPRRFGRWLGWMLAPLAATALVFAGRATGLAERFSLLQEFDFGWRIPALSAEGWLGMVSGTELQAWDFYGLRWVLSAGVVGVLGWAFLRAIQQKRRAVWTALAVSVPILAGYIFLQARGARLGTNASYDAYKLFAVFYPLLLPAFCWWVTLRRSRRLHEWLFVCSVAAVVVAFNLVACGMFVWKLSRAPLRVGAELVQLQAIEAQPDIRSVNLLIPDMWSRLWANAFLLRKPQYFLTHTYEGRLNTALRGEWDLEGGVISVRLPGDARRQINARFALVNTRHPAFIRVTPRDGWHAEEFLPAGEDRWRWTQGEATLLLDNPHDYTLSLGGELEGWSPSPRQVALLRAGGEERPFVVVPTTRGRVTLPVLGLPPGPSVLRLATPQPPTRIAEDPRPFGVAVHRLTFVPHR